MVFPARISARQANRKGCKVIGQVFGGKCGESSASYDPKSSSWKTCQISLISELNTYSDHWPKSGMMRNGTLYPRKTSVRPISANASGLWPTPLASSGGEGLKPSNFKPSTKAKHKKQHGWHLGAAAKDSISNKPIRRWPTPTATRARNATSGRKAGSKHHSGTTLYDIAYQEGGKLNPQWVEWLMGYPTGWTDLKDSETPSSHKSSNGSPDE